MGGLCSLPVVWIPFLTYASMLWLPGLWQSVPLILRQATVGPHLHWKLPDTHSKSGSVSCGGHCFFLLGPGSHILLCPPRVCFPVLWKFSNQVPLAFKVKFVCTSFSAFCCLRRHLSSCKPCSKPSQVPTSLYFLPKHQLQIQNYCLSYPFLAISKCSYRSIVIILKKVGLIQKVQVFIKNPLGIFDFTRGICILSLDWGISISYVNSAGWDGCFNQNSKQEETTSKVWRRGMRSNIETKSWPLWRRRN